MLYEKLVAQHQSLSHAKHKLIDVYRQKWQAKKMRHI